MHTLSRLRLAVGLATLAIALPSLAATPAYSLADRVNVRSRPGYAGEILTQLSHHQPITVLGTNTLSQPAPDEPPVWLRISLPPKTLVWVASDFVDTNSFQVTADVLNVRSGPSYDHAIIARLPRNSPVQLAEEPPREGWLPILSPSSAFGFVPASWVTFSLHPTAPTPNQTLPTPDTAPATDPTASVAVTTPAPPPAVSPSPQVIATSDTPTRSDYTWFDQFVRSYRTDSNSTPTTSSAPLIPPSASTPAPTIPDPNLFITETTPTVTPQPPTPTTPEPTPTTPTLSQPANTQDFSDLPLRTDLAGSPARFVRREGVVVRSWNVAAPSPFALRPVDGGEMINFLITSRYQPLNLRELRGRTIIVTGREYLDQRTFWRDIPLLDVESIEAVR